MSEETKVVKPYGLQWWLCGAIMHIVIAAAATGALSTDLAGSFALMLSIGILCNEIGERIPFWNSYVGGGLVLAFLFKTSGPAGEFKGVVFGHHG